MLRVRRLNSNVLDIHLIDVILLREESVKIVFALLPHPPSEKGSSLKGNIFLPVGKLFPCKGSRQFSHHTTSSNVVPWVEYKVDSGKKCAWVILESKDIQIHNIVAASM